MSTFVPQFPLYSDPQGPAPYGFKNVHSWIFAVKTQDSYGLNQVCDRFLNDFAASQGSPLEFRPIQSVVYLHLLKYGRMYSLPAPFDTFGYTAQNELAFAIPIAVLSGGVFTGVVGLFVPVLFVDNDWSLITGRDVVGYPKVQGWFYPPKSYPASLAGFSLEARVAGPVGADALADPKTVLAIRNDYGELEAGTGAIWPWGPVDSLYRPDAGRVPIDNTAIFNALVNSAGIGFTGHAFKQLRDFEEPEKATYKAITRFSLRVRQFTLHQLAWLAPSIFVYDHPGLPIANTLRLARRIDGSLDVLATARVEADLDLIDPKNLLVECAGQPHRRGKKGFDETPPLTSQVEEAPTAPDEPKQSDSASESESGHQCCDGWARGIAATAQFFEQESRRWERASRELEDGGYDFDDAVEDVGRTYRHALRYYAKLWTLWF